MNDRVSQTILLCEDALQERLTRAYMKRYGLNTDPPFLKSIVASQMQHGGNIGWVLREYPRQLYACRQRCARARTLLIVFVDADDSSIEERLRQLADEVERSGAAALDAKEPVAILIPRRHVETWICSLLGQNVDESENCKNRHRPTKEELRQAAGAIYDWARPAATPGITCVGSLRSAFPAWRMIG